MTRADCVHSTPPLCTSVSLPPAEAPIDPIFAAIEAHKAAHAEWAGWLHRICDLEDELAAEKRRTFLTSRHQVVAETDDPRWVEAQHEQYRTCVAETDAAIRLLEVIPTTKSGVCALLNHAIAYDADGEGWPRDVYAMEGEREISRSWQQLLIKNLAAALLEAK
jgi:hypothetical protein